MKTNSRLANNKRPRELKEIWLLVYFFLSIFWMEIVARAYFSEYFFGWEFFRIMLLGIPAVFVLHICATFIQGKGGKITAGVLLGLAVLLIYSQIVYYTTFKTFYSLFSVTQAGQIFEFWKETLQNILDTLVYLILLLLPLLFYIFLCRHVLFVYRQIKRLYTLMLAVSFIIAEFLLFLPAARDMSSDMALNLGQSDPKSSAQEVGIINTMGIDLLRTIFPEKDSSAALDDLYVPQATPSVMSASADGSGASAGTSSSENSSETVADNVPRECAYNVMDFDFNALADARSDDAVAKLDRYFASAEPSRQNSYTGMFKGYNVIFLTGEAFSSHAVDKDLTPTLYKMVHEGFHFTNFYNPSWGVSTSDGEYQNCLGLVPKSGVWSMKASADNYLPFALGNQLNAIGYTSYAYHPHTYTYYGRDKSYPALGYSIYKARGNGLEITPTWPESDLEAMQNSVDDYIGNEPFHVYFMTVSGHLEYNFGGNMMAYRHKDEVKDLPYSERPRAYVACQMETDRALEYLLSRLEDAGIADRTIIVMGGDHYPYGLENEEISEFLGHPVEPLFELHKSSLILYVAGMQPETVDKPCCSMDILPTVSNLLGLTYDSRLLMGRDIFSDAPPLIMFQDKSFITDKGSYNRKAKKFIPFEDGLPDDYREQISAIIDAKFAASAKILELDYYKKLFNAGSN